MYTNVSVYLLPLSPAWLIAVLTSSADGNEIFNVTFYGEKCATDSTWERWEGAIVECHCVFITYYDLHWTCLEFKYCTYFSSFFVLLVITLYITVDFTTTALPNGASTYWCISKQVHYIKHPFHTTATWKVWNFMKTTSLICSVWKKINFLKILF